MEYFILGAVSAVVALALWLFWIMLDNMAETEPERPEDRVADDAALDGIRAANAIGKDVP